VAKTFTVAEALVAKAHPRVKLHVICDNYATHKHDDIGR
jgi:hypothetical protein